MKLYELIGIKKLADKEPEQIATWLKSEFDAGNTKLRPLGKGSLGLAITNGKHAWKFWMKDSGYEKFVELARSKPNPYYPKFLSPVRELPRFFKLSDSSESSKTDWSKVKYVKMELLSPYNKTSKADEFELFTPQVLAKNPDIKEWIEDNDDYGLGNFVGLEGLFEYGYELSDDLSNNAGTVSWLKSNMLDLKKEDAKFLTSHKLKFNPVILKACEAIGQINNIRPNDARFDYGYRNLAMRGDQVVFLDPLVDDEDIEISDLLLKLNDFKLS